MSNLIEHRFIGTPSLMSPDAASYIPGLDECVRKNQDEYGLDFMDQGPYWNFSPSRFRPYNVQQGVLTIPVKGVLLSDFPYMIGAATGYQYIEAALNRGMEDPTVQRIVLLIDSPGGEVAENFDLVDRIGSMTAKPITALVPRFAFSAAYNIAAAADEIITTQTGSVGSIGVVTMHVDVSQAMENAGIRVTHIYAGENKVDGNMFEPLDDETRERIQRRVDTMYETFVGQVASNRQLELDKVRGTQALTYDGNDAVEIGLADSIKPISVATREIYEERMTDSAEALSEAWHAGFDEGQKEAASEREAAVSNERQRIAAIVESDEGKQRPAAALKVALKTPMDETSARQFLAELPTEAAPSFYSKMDETKNPDVGVENQPDVPADVAAGARSIGLAGLKRS